MKLSLLETKKKQLLENYYRCGRGTLDADEVVSCEDLFFGGGPETFWMQTDNLSDIFPSIF